MLSAAEDKRSDPFSVTVQEAGPAQVQEVGTGLKITGELGEAQALTYQIKLAADKTYVIHMVSPNPEALDPFLRLLDAAGKQLAEDDDSGGDLDARIVFRAEAAGTYQVVAACVGKGHGPFTLTVREAPD